MRLRPRTLHFDDELPARTPEVEGVRAPTGVLGQSHFQPVGLQALVHRVYLGLGFQVKANMKQLGISRVFSFHQVEVHPAPIAENGHLRVVVLEGFAEAKVLFEEATSFLNVADRSGLHDRISSWRSS